MHALIVYTGRDNDEDYVLLADGAVIDTTPFTRWILTVVAVTLDTAVTSDWIMWPFTIILPKAKFGLPAGASVKGVRFRLGSKGLAAGIHADCRLVVYDAQHPNGMVVSDGVEVRVLA